jgi:rhodanese-related sulfurtransferase
MDHSPRFLSLVEAAKKNVTEISVHEAQARLKAKQAVLIDVREESEWLTGHAEGAVYLGKGIVERDIEKRFPDPTTPLMCYCGGGFRSALVVDSLQKMGYSQVVSISGGYKYWVAAHLPVTTRPEILPRSPHEKLADVVHLPRLIDKARLFPQGKLPGYNYLNTGLDKALLDFLCVEGREFEAAVQINPDDIAVIHWLKGRLGAAWPADHNIKLFNDKMTSRRPDTTEKQQLFDQIRAKYPSTKKRVETIFDLIDLEEGRIV